MKVVVTGGSNGIGLAICRAFTSKGDKVWVVDKDKNSGEAFVELYPGNLFSHVNLANEKEIVAFFKKLKVEWGYPDILINNAGISKFSNLKDCSTTFWDEVIAVNLRAPFIFAREYARLHPGNQFGRIINISSTRHLMSEPGGEAYGASKGGLVSLTHALANSLSGSGITVNCISPGWIDTGSFDNITPEDHAQHLSGRVGKPIDVASAVLFLCNPANDFINGAEIRIDGGMTRKMIYV